MLWIKDRQKQDIPKELYYDGWQTDNDVDDQTPLMLWIKHRPNEPIPEEFYYNYC